MLEAIRWSTPEERREQILSQLRDQDRTSVGELSQIFSVSEVTMRKDLDLLESQGLLKRVHGGAVVSGRGRLELYFAAREQMNLDAKRRIAQAAVAYIRSNQNVFLDASTTAFQIARLLKDHDDLTVITNGLYTALELSCCPGITVVVVGDVVRRRSSSLVGGLSNDLVKRLHIDTAFFGARGITARAGLTETDIHEAQLKQRMVSSAETVVGVADSSKFGQAHLNAFALPDELDRVITDSAAPAEVVAELRERGVAVDLV